MGVGDREQMLQCDGGASQATVRLPCGSGIDDKCWVALCWLMGVLWVLKDDTNARESGGGKLLSYQPIQRHVSDSSLDSNQLSLPPNSSWNPHTDLALPGIICSYQDFLIFPPDENRPRDSTGQEWAMFLMPTSSDLGRQQVLPTISALDDGWEAEDLNLEMQS